MLEKKSYQHHAHREDSPPTAEIPPDGPHILPLSAASAFRPYLIPLSIIIAGIFVACGIIVSGVVVSRQGAAAGTSDAPQAASDAEQARRLDEMAKQAEPVSAGEHIRGSATARVALIEYADYDCSFCKLVHSELKRVADNFAANDVVWVYRHFPLASLHPRAHRKAEASECVTELGGNEAFWKFTDLLFTETAVSDDELAVLASKSGVNKKTFASCLSSGKYSSQIDADIQKAIKTGAQGTPHVILKSGDTFAAFKGSQPYAAYEAAINPLLGR